MTPIQRWTSVLLAVTVLSGGPMAWAQATFSVSSTAATVIRTGHAEPVGALTFSVVSGTTIAEVIPIDLRPAVLTSDAVVISTSPAQTGFSATVDRDAGRVELHVPDDIGPGTAVHVEGLRMSVPASGIETLDARISTIENRLTTGEPGRPGHRASRRRHRHRSFDRFGLHLQLGPGAHRPSRPLHLQRGVRGGVLRRDRDHLPGVAAAQKHPAPVPGHDRIANRRPVDDCGQ